MFRTALITTLLLTPVAASAQRQAGQVAATAGRYATEITHTSVTFRVRPMGRANYTARFTKMEPLLDFDPVRPERSKLTATVDTGSVETDYENRDKDCEFIRQGDAR